jgi:raffinose/stachyose/melibiose transport system substrate-binding protein
MAALAIGPAARPTAGDAVTISMLAYTNEQPGLNVLIPNFERVYPSIKIVVTYAGTIASLQQLETTELATGSAPDLLTVQPACGTPISVCVLGKYGDLAPMVSKPWVKWLVPLVTSADKYAAGLFTFSAQISPYGIFTNDALFRKLGLSVPSTFPQLLTVCQKAKAAGIYAISSSGDGQGLGRLAEALAVAPVYGADPRWTAELKAGSATFDGTQGWHTALQELVEMYQDGCFEPGLVGTVTTSAIAGFAQGESLMFANTSSQKGAVDTAGPQFSYSFHSFPGGISAGQTATALNLNFSPGVNAHSGAANQAAAQSFVDFLARPKQTALYAEVEGGLTQYEFLKNQVPAFMSTLAPVLKAREYVVLPEETWWNAAVTSALDTYIVGVLTGQTTVDGVLNAMDAAWKQGPS